jgi:hypothetical protein
MQFLYILFHFFFLNPKIYIRQQYTKVTLTLQNAKVIWPFHPIKGLFGIEGEGDTRYFVFVSKVNYIKEPSEMNYEASLIWVGQQREQ